MDDFGDVLVVDVPEWELDLLLQGFAQMDIHVLVVTSSGIFIVSGNVDNGASLDGKVGIANSVSSSDFWALGVQRDGKRSAWEFLLCCLGVVYDGLVVLSVV